MSLNVELLEQSFELVKPQADEFVASFYGNLLTDYPDAKPLFAHTSMPKQQQMLKGALVMVVENLRKPEVLSEALTGLGARHVKYGALPEHYPLVGNSLLKTLGQYAGDAWTPELKEAWTEAYGAITALMLEGADYKESEVLLEQQPTASATTPTPSTPSTPTMSSTTNALPDASVTPPSVPMAGTTSAMTMESPQGISNGTAFGIIGAGGVATLLLLLILL
ncbi:MAG: globin family protein [Cyanobacteria bacterium J06634_6]